MANQETPKKLTFEEVERPKEKIENPTEEDKSVRLSDINHEILKKEEGVQDTRIKIDDIRNQLGLPLTDETPPSIKMQQESIEKLNQERYDIETKIKEIEGRAKNMTTNEGEKFSVLTNSNDIKEYKELKKRLENSDVQNLNQETKKSEEIKRFESNLRTAIEDISTKSKAVLNALHERQQDRLTTLQSSEDFQMMVSSIKNLKNFESKIDINSVSEIIDNVNRLSRSLDDIKIQRSSVMREDPQNLEKLIHGAKSFSISVDGNRRRLPVEMKDKQMEEKSKKLRISLQELTEQSEKLWLFASKLKESVR